MVIPIRTDEHACRLCRKEFDSLTEKVTHDCPHKPENKCSKKKCGREPDEGEEYCPDHKPKPWTNHVGVKKSEEMETPVWDVEIHYNYVLRVDNVKAENKDVAVEKAEEAYDPELVDRVHRDIQQVGTATDLQTFDKWEKKPTMFRKLDSMEVEGVTGEKPDLKQKGGGD